MQANTASCIYKVEGEMDAKKLQTGGIADQGRPGARTPRLPPQRHPRSRYYFEDTI